MNSVCASSTVDVADTLRLERQLALQGLLRRRLDRLGAVELGDEDVLLPSAFLQIDLARSSLAAGCRPGVGNRQCRLASSTLAAETSGIDQGNGGWSLLTVSLKST